MTATYAHRGDDAANDTWLAQASQCRECASRSATKGEGGWRGIHVANMVVYLLGRIVVHR